ncbi:hypothetical protein FXW07_06425 [Methanosarcina sp. DH1]|uniref:hypothetical protein n=1 Tax=Methanosarcina sp. DH1 TaxID=2605695 RepID=UPI001E354EE2|nr:hypothetical protein [Methanosarcina sp. DH1]MCC4766258.1 hypothetical protein [Methanosarcina sp. DH1]
MNSKFRLINQQNQQLKNQNRSLNWKSEPEIRTGTQNWNSKLKIRTKNQNRILELKPEETDNKPLTHVE